MENHRQIIELNGPWLPVRYVKLPEGRLEIVGYIYIYKYSKGNGVVRYLSILGILNWKGLKWKNWTTNLNGWLIGWVTDGFFGWSSLKNGLLLTHLKKWWFRTSEPKNWIRTQDLDKPNCPLLCVLPFYLGWQYPVTSIFFRGWNHRRNAVKRSNQTFTTLTWREEAANLGGMNRE